MPSTGGTSIDSRIEWGSMYLISGFIRMVQHDWYADMWAERFKSEISTKPSPADAG